jgi:glycosyltransferase involved in cell wall biosynthesis
VCEFTVFTATFNRAHTLHRVHDSLVAQTYRNLEWVVVDDGSSDNTRQLVNDWQQAADFPIHYEFQENAGKHIAFNRGVRAAQGKLFVSIDSDDACVPTALERLKYHWDELGQRQASFVGVTSLCQDQQGRLVGTRFPRDPTDSNELEMRYGYRVKGEKWAFHRTDVLRQFPFPESERKTYLPECVVWNRIARRYQTRYINEMLRVYWVDEPSLVHGQDPGRHAVGGRLQHLAALNDETEWFAAAPTAFLRSAVHYSRFSFHVRLPLPAQWRALNSSLGRSLWLAGLPLGFAVFVKDRWVHRRARS